MKRLPLLLFLVVLCAATAVTAQTVAPSTQKTKPTTDFNCSLHLVTTDSKDANAVELKWHPDYRVNSDGKTSVRLSKVHYAGISSSGRANNVLECGATMGVEIVLDGASSAKISVLKESFPDGKFAFVIDNQVVALLDFVNGISKYNIVIPVTSDLQAQQIERIAMRNSGR